jgi:hypothetical protein
MRYLFCFLILVVTTNILYAQKSSIDVGFRAVNMFHFIEDNGSGNQHLQSVIGTSIFKNNGQVLFDKTGGFYKIKQLQSKGFALPQLYIHAKITKKLWVRNAIQFYASKIENNDNFDIQIGTYSEGYTTYKINKIGISNKISLQMQWLQNKKWNIQSGLSSEVRAYHSKVLLKGYSMGCFGGSNISVDKSKNNLEFLYPTFSNAISYRCKKLVFTYENFIDVINVKTPTLYHQISIGTFLK